jgi:hypothetical protein
MESYQQLPEKSIEFDLEYASKKLKKLDSKIKTYEKSDIPDKKDAMKEIQQISNNLKQVFKAHYTDKSEKIKLQTLENQYKQLLSKLSSIQSSQINERSTFYGSSIDKDSVIFHSLSEMEKKQAIENSEAISEIHKDALLVNEMVNDINILVQQQGQDLKKIDRDVSLAADQTDKAAKELDKAQDYQSKSRRKKIILVLCIIFVILIAVIGFLFKDQIIEYFKS